MIDSFFANIGQEDLKMLIMNYLILSQRNVNVMVLKFMNTTRTN